RRRQPFSHYRAAQRPNAIKHVKADATHALHWEKIGQQAAIKQVEGKCAAIDVGASQLIVSRQQVRSADVAAIAPGSDGKLADRSGITQAEIEPLRADGRDHMRGLADERNSFVGK